MNEIINTPKLPPPRGFSHAVKAGNTVYLASQIGAGATFEAQIDTALEHLILALGGAGGGPAHLVSLQRFVTDVQEYRDATPALGPVWRKHFGGHYPAMGLFGVPGLAVPEAKVEVMGIAVIDS